MLAGPVAVGFDGVSKIIAALPHPVVLAFLGVGQLLGLAGDLLAVTLSGVVTGRGERGDGTREEDGGAESHASVLLVESHGLYWVGGSEGRPLEEAVVPEELGAAS